MGTNVDRVERLRALLVYLRQRWGFPSVSGEDSRDFAQRLGVSRNRVYRWECEEVKQITDKPVRDLAKGIGIRSDVLNSYLDGEIKLADLQAHIPSGELHQVIAPIKTLTANELEQVLDAVILALRQDVGTYGLRSVVARCLLRLFSTRETLLFWRLMGDIIFADPVELLTIQGLIVAELGVKDRPWSDSTQPLNVFDAEAGLLPGRCLAILSGQQPSPAEIEYLSRVLSHPDGSLWDVNELTRLVEDQYQDSKPEPSPTDSIQKKPKSSSK